LSDISQKQKIVNDYAKQEATKFIAGARSLSEFDTFVQEMKSKGADDVVTTINEWYTKK
jgi:putative aldouronate transport system substrate-binding protein